MTQSPSDFNLGDGWREIPDRGPVDESLIGREVISIGRYGGGSGIRWWVREEPVPQLPTDIGAVITWRESNDAGPNVSVFAELETATEWRVNGFDLDDADGIESRTRGKKWEILEPRAVTAQAILDHIWNENGGPVNGYTDLAKEYGVDR